MRIEKIGVDTLLKDPKNSRKHDKKNIRAIKGSLKKFGQQKPIVVDHNNIVIAGNGTLQAASELGWQVIEIVRSDLEGFDATAYAIADNRTSELASWDDTILNSTLAALQKEGLELSSIGFDEGDWRGPSDLPNMDEQTAQAEIQFSKFIGESNNYIVILFKNDIDWLQATDHFKLTSKANAFMDGSVQTIGIGRIIDGAEYLYSMTHV